MNFVFVTGNQDKVVWLEKFLGETVEHHKIDIDELQSPKPEKVLRHKALKAYSVLKRPILVDDVSLSFNEWGDMPGTFIKFFVDGPGLEKVCRMLDGFDDRGAEMRVSYGYYDGKEFTMVTATNRGSIAIKPGTGDMGHGFDSIFIPEGASDPRSDMTEEEYKQSHPRGAAAIKLKKFLA